MLLELKILNYALIRELEIGFGRNLNTITGETGAGKSILLGAIGLILGNRADTSALLDENRKCVIEGRFDITHYQLKPFFEQNDLDWEEHTLLRREISPAGKSRAFINDTPVTLNVLKELGEKLVDIHSQHQTIKLTEPAFQVSLLDAFARHKNLLETYSRHFRQYKGISRQLQQLKDEAARAQKDYDYNLFQLNEISSANLQAEEQELLDEELNLLTHAESIQQNLMQARYLLDDDERSINNRLQEVRKQLGSISSFNSKLDSLYKRVDDLLVESRDIYREIEDFSDSVTVDNRRMEEINLRLQTINHLLHKHQCRDLAELLKYATELQVKVSSVESLSDETEELETQIKALHTELERLAAEISANRRQQTDKLQTNLEGLLRQAGIPEAQIVIKMEALPQLADMGKDAVEILFSANRGSRPAPVSQVASGGELSRLMLCFKYILADSIFLPTIIFDEIDTGISGEVAIKVGRMIKQMSGNHQVICITHQPQVAAMGSQQYMVYKRAGEEITTTHIRSLNHEERVEEIAKMIAGHQPSRLAIENARELLAES